jgi:hypothetical protein
MFPGGEEAPEPLPIRGAGRNPLHTLSLSQSHRQLLLFDAKYPLTSKNSPPYTSTHRKQCLIKKINVRKHGRYLDSQLG